jgi:hypothetical protein
MDSESLTGEESHIAHSLLSWLDSVTFIDASVMEMDVHTLQNLLSSY